MTLRVVHCGTGFTGREALRAIIEDPSLELVGQYVSTPEKVGKDAGEFCGLPATGVLATGDLDALVQMKADCLSYAGNAVGRELEAVEEMAEFLRAGTNVVTFAVVEISYPPATPAEFRELIESACKAGGTSLYATGGEPGAISMNVPAGLLSMSGDVTGFCEQQIYPDLANGYPLETVLRESMGFGKPDGFAPARLTDGTVEVRWTPQIKFLADLLGIDLDGIELEWETAATPVDIETPNVGTYPAGTLCGYYWRLSGMVAGKPVVSAEYIAQITPDAQVPEHWPRLPAGIDGGIAYTVKGRPTYRTFLVPDPMPEGINSGLAMTALAATNAIPAVVAARPGHLSPTDLPFYASRRGGSLR